MAVGESKSAMGSVEFHWHKLQWVKYLVNIVGAMQHTSKQFHICIMKKFRQQFKIAIITPSDGFTQISINFANQVSSQKTAPSWQGIQNVRGSQGTVNSMEFFRGKALALQTRKQITTLITVCGRYWLFIMPICLYVVVAIDAVLLRPQDFFHLAGFVAELSLKNTTAFNEEFILVSRRLGLVIFSLVLAVQCLVFVVGVLIVAASVSRCALFLLAGVDSSLPDVVVVTTDSHAAGQTQSVDVAAVERLRGLTVDDSEAFQASLSTSDSVSLSAVRLFSETKV